MLLNEELRLKEFIAKLIFVVSLVLSFAFIRDII